MRVYPVRYWNTADNAKMKHVRVKAFTSGNDAKAFRREMAEKPNIAAEILDTEDYPLNKHGILEAFKRGQTMLIKSEFVQSQ